MNFVIALVIGLIVGGIVLGSLLSQLKTVVQQHAAADYIKKGSMNVTHRNDQFLYRKTDRTPIQRQAPPQR